MDLRPIKARFPERFIRKSIGDRRDKESSSSFIQSFKINDLVKKFLARDSHGKVDDPLTGLRVVLKGIQVREKENRRYEKDRFSYRNPRIFNRSFR